jgi:anti-sigma-K factor RskA
MTFQPWLREGAMYDEDQDALAAEYVLGTLSVEERGHAEALLLIDTNFVELVHQWERRLGELNVMVESVEPPADLWEKIKPDIGTVPASDKVPLAPIGPTPLTKTETAAVAQSGVQESSLLDALASKLLPPEAGAAVDVKAAAKPASGWLSTPSLSPATPVIERGTDAFYLARRVRLWRIMALATGVLALLLAAFIGLSQVAPGLVSALGWGMPRLFAATPTATEPPGSQLVAVLQREPTSPAFLLTVDPGKRTLTVRRILAKAGAGHSYELWVTTQGSSQRRSLGIVGDEEFTQRPASLDAGALLTASYEISYEPAGGSQKGAPSGPILFTGKMVRAVPPPQPQQK